MTIEREPPGIWRAVCDGCGDAETLDDEAEQQLVDLGWKARPVETIKFSIDVGGGRRHKVQYREHDCADCV